MRRAVKPCFFCYNREKPKGTDMANTKKRLTAKEQKLVHEYIRIGNITQAAIIAGYPKRSASSVGSDVLKKPDVKAYYDAQMAELARDSIMGAREALELLTSIDRKSVV